MNQSSKVRFLVYAFCLLFLASGLVFCGCSNDDSAASNKDSNNAVSRKAESSSESNAEAVPPIEPVAADLPVVNNEAFHESLVESAKTYIRYPMVNSVAEVAPADCAAPTEPEARPKMSESEDDQSHGQKLYYLFAKDITHYLSPEGKDAPVGQVLVKESWASKESNPDARNLRNHASGNRINPRVDHDGKVLEIGKRNALFVMMKLDSKTADTDQGWVYGVVDPDTKAVSASGKVASCMECHESAKHDRLFGTDLAAMNE